MERQKKFVWNALAVLLGLALAVLAARYLLGALLPFALAWAVAAALEPGLSRLRRHLPLRRRFVAAAVTLVLSGTVLAAAVAICRRLIREATAFLTQLPALLRQLPALGEAWSRRVEQFCAACPDSAAESVRRFLALVTERLGQWAAGLAEAGLSWLGDAVAALPQIVLFAVTLVLAIDFTVAGYPDLCALARRRLPPEWMEKLRVFRRALRTALGRWLRAQGLLIALTFTELLAGLLLLRQPYALLLALSIALIDALPVFGTGTVLLPWALVLCLIGAVPRGIALAALYAVITVVRSILEPRLMAKGAGLPPLGSLMALYLGFRLAGVAGMVLFPVALLLLKELYDAAGQK